MSHRIEITDRLVLIVAKGFTLCSECSRNYSELGIALQEDYETVFAIFPCEQCRKQDLRTVEV